MPKLTSSCSALSMPAHSAGLRGGWEGIGVPITVQPKGKLLGIPDRCPQESLRLLADDIGAVGQDLARLCSDFE